MRLDCDHQWIDYCHPLRRCLKCLTVERKSCQCDECRLTHEQWRDRRRADMAAKIKEAEGD